VTGARTFDELLAALDPAQGRPLVADLYGSTGLGEFYADAVLDQRGAADARRHLVALGMDPQERVDDRAVAAVLALVNEMAPPYRYNTAHFHDHTYVYPREFAQSRGTTLIGYSERLYYAERELLLTPDSKLPRITEADVSVKPLAFAAASNGTPSWVDAFVVPRGKLAPKRREIAAFLSFATSKCGYAPFIQPAVYPAVPSYLLPAMESAYDADVAAKEPVLGTFRDQLDGSLVIDDPHMLNGLKKAGKVIRSQLPKP
jgi:hypothetical protein